MDIKQIRYFVVCAEAGSFSEAAGRLYTTQPNVSKVIKAMEEEIGSPLFERCKKGIRLTSRGKRIYDYACRILEDVNCMLREDQ